MKKKLFSLFAIALFIVPMFMFVTACGGDDGKKFDKCSVKDWDYFTAIAAGTISESQMEKSKNLKGDERLLGKKKDGSFEVISFLNSSEKEVKANLYLSGFTAYDNYIFVNFNREDKGEGIKQFSYGENDFSYLIDYNGNVYYLNDIFSYMNLSQKGYCESDTSVYVTGAKKSNSEYCYYRICIEKEKLAVKKVVTVSKYKATGFFVDKFDNMFLIEKGTIADVNYSEEVVLIKSNEATVKLSSKADKKADEYSVYKALNGQVYFKPDAVGEIYKTFDKDGEFVELLAGVPTNYYVKENLIKETKDTKYYFSKQANTSGTVFTAKIFKMSIITKADYTVEEIISQTGKSFAYDSDKLYSVGGGNAFVTDLASTNKIEINSDISFQEVWSDLQGNICYKGTKSGDEVQGTIKPNGTITQELPTTDFDIKFIKAM